MDPLEVYSYNQWAMWMCVTSAMKHQSGVEHDLATARAYLEVIAHEDT